MTVVVGANPSVDELRGGSGGGGDDGNREGGDVGHGAFVGIWVSERG